MMKIFHYLIKKTIESALEFSYWLRFPISDDQHQQQDSSRIVCQTSISDSLSDKLSFTSGPYIQPACSLLICKDLLFGLDECPQPLIRFCTGQQHAGCDWATHYPHVFHSKPSLYLQVAFSRAALPQTKPFLKLTCAVFLVGFPPSPEL